MSGPPSPSLSLSSSDDFPISPLSLPLPSGTYTLLPLVSACDNFTLPTGPWTANDCATRRETYDAKIKARKLARRVGSVKEEEAVTTAATVGDSAIADDDSDDEDALPSSATNDDDEEFLVPLFLSIPSSPSHPSVPSTPAPLSRRSSSTGNNNGRPSFSRLTPMPSLRPSSPTFSHPGLPVDDGSAQKKKQKIKPQPIGFLRPSVVEALIADNKKMVAINCKPIWSFQPPLSFPVPTPSRRPSRSYSRSSSRRDSVSLTPLTPSSPSSPSVQSTELKNALNDLRLTSGAREEDAMGVWAVGFEEWVNEEGEGTRSEHVERVVRGWKMAGMFADQLDGWRDELYSIYAPAPPYDPENPTLPGSNLAFAMERSACALFGLQTFGVHLTAYIPPSPSHPTLRLYIPRRSSTKPTWPSYLDNTVAGGITHLHTPHSTILRECIEEASLPPSYVVPRLTQGGVLVYTYRGKEGWVQPEVQYVYDLKMEDPQEEGAQKPRVNDGEVEQFWLMELEEVVKRMCEGEFKPNCALVIIDFLIRHGYLTPESDSRFLEVASKLRGSLVLPGPA